MSAASSTRPVRCVFICRMMTARRCERALAPGGEEPVAASTDSGEEPSNGECSGWSDLSPAGIQGIPVRPGAGFACGALPSGRRWSTAVAVDNNEGYRRGLWPAARPAVTALTFKRLIRGNSSTNRRRTDATATNG